MNVKQATAILMGNLKGPKNKPTNLIELSLACEVLIKEWGIKEVARYFDTSQYMIRQIEKINQLDSDTKKYIKKEKLGIEKSYHLWRLNKSKRQEVLPLIKNLTSSDVRNLVYVIIHEPTKSIKECKKIFDSKYTKETTIMALSLPPDLRNRLTQISKKKNLNPVQFVKNLIEVACHE